MTHGAMSLSNQVKMQSSLKPNQPNDAFNGKKEGA